MSETPPFTAQQIRAQAHWVRNYILRDRSGHLSIPGEGDGYALSAMLDAFAQRLEQEEQQQAAFAATEGAAYAIVPHGAAEALREEGRREILKDVAKLDPMEEDGDRWVCTFCYPGWTEGRESVQHKPDCLWWRAQQARQTPETP